MYRLSADQENADAQYRLGMMYVNGEGVPQDDLEAYKWLSLSVSYGDRTAIIARDRVADKMTPSKISQAQKLAQKWKQKREALSEKIR